MSRPNNTPPAPDGATVLKFTPTAPIACERCEKPIASGETYCRVRTPTGEAPVHHGCMGGRPL